MELTTSAERAAYVADERYAWPGGYALFAMCSDGGLLCPACCEENKNEIEADNDNPRSDWHIVGIVTAEILEEPEQCVHCGRELLDM